MVNASNREYILTKGWHYMASELAVKPIKEYCEKRKFKCKGCRYSIKFIIPDYKGHACCVFGDCPCDWKVD